MCYDLLLPYCWASGIFPYFAIIMITYHWGGGRTLPDRSGMDNTTVSER